MKDYQLGTNFMKDENSDLLGNSHNILNRWMTYICYLLNVHGVNDIRQTQMHATESLAPEPSCFKV
jgi:hypothetical protein